MTAAAPKSMWEEALTRVVSWWGLPAPEAQYRFHPERRWRFDFAWPERKVAVEVDGGIWINGRHNRASGYEADCEKLNEAACLGWRVIRVTQFHITSGQVCEWLERLLGVID